MHHVMNSLSTVTLQEIRGYHVQVWIPIQFIRRDNASESGIFGLGREFLDSLWTGGHMSVSQTDTELIHRCHCVPAGSNLVPIQSLLKAPGPGPKRAI